MKKGLILLFSLIVLVSTGFSRDEFVITKVSQGMLQPPAVGGNRGHGGGNDQWLAVEADFKANVDLTEELTFKYLIAINGKCVTGESTYVSIEKGRDLHSVMFLSPRALRRLAYGKRFSPNMVENITVQIVSKGEVVAQRSLREVGQWWAKLEPVKGEVLKKSETPFAWADWDYYEELKPETH
jgi:hypothetical protein